jgi:hypothetical protein
VKTLTEFSTLLLRKAAAARVAALGAEGDALTEAVATAMAVPPDRAARLLEALDIAGDLDSVRLVRVFQGETGPHGSVSRGEFHYAVDRVAAPPKRRSRDDRGDRRAGTRGRGREKPRGLGSLRAGAGSEEKDERDERPGRGEMPRAGIGWQLTSAPREMREGRGDRGQRRAPQRLRGPSEERRGFGRPGGPGGPGGPSDDSRGRRSARRPPRAARLDGPATPTNPTGEPPTREDASLTRRQRKPIGPDANGLGPDGTPWDPDRRRKRLEQRAMRMDAAAASPVEPSHPRSPEHEPAQDAAKE